MWSYVARNPAKNLAKNNARQIGSLRMIFVQHCIPLLRIMP